MRTCKKCGSIYPDSGDFCPSCGTSKQYNTYESTKIGQNKTPHKTIFIVLGALFLVLGITSFPGGLLLCLVGIVLLVLAFPTAFKSPQGKIPLNISKPDDFQSDTFDFSPSADIISEYALTIFLYVFDSRPCVVRDNDDYPVYITTECGIAKPKAYHENLIKNGYFQESSFASILSLATLPELKSILDNLGLKKTGKKSELVARIDENVSEEFKQSYTKNKKYYELSEKGQHILDKNKDFVLLHRNKLWDISPVEYIHYKEKDSNKTFPEVCVDVLNERIKKYNKQKKYNLVMCTYLHKAQLYETEKNLSLSLYNYLVALLYDISGALNTFEGKLNTFDGKYYPGMPIYFYISHRDKIMTYQNECSDEMLREIYDNHKPDFCICSYKFFVEIVHEIFDDTLDEEKTVKKLKSLFIQKTK